MDEDQDSPPVNTAVVHAKKPALIVRASVLFAKLQKIWKLVQWRKVAIFFISLFLFIFAIYTMKEGAKGLTPLVRNTLAVDTPLNSLGFGWLFAYIVMSGSPVAAVALTFFTNGIVDQLGAFTMITGSRLGASFIVLFIGFLYVLRGKDRASSLSMGLLSLSVTATTYLVALIIGISILSSGVFDGVQLRSGALVTSVVDMVLDPVLSFISGILPDVLLFLVGLGVIIFSLNLFDKALPQMAIKGSQVGSVSRLVYRPWVMFLMGAAITLISMSVSVSLSILVPLSNRGFIRRENVIPYIMGANITTFIDTLLAAVLLNNPQAFTVVLVEMISILIVSVIILMTFFHSYERSMLAFVKWITASNRNLFIFMAFILIVPLILMLL
jgi:solute carrier family 34 (sodium-dependent phosphate cotransporter)